MAIPSKGGANSKGSTMPPEPNPNIRDMHPRGSNFFRNFPMHSCTPIMYDRVKNFCVVTN